jgi:hypothetical protein
VKIFIPANIWEAIESRSLRDLILSKAPSKVKEKILFNTSAGNQREIMRACCWTWTTDASKMLVTNGSLPQVTMLIITFHRLGKAKAKEMILGLDIEAAMTNISRSFCCKIKTIPKKMSVIASVELSGELQNVSNIDDLRDLFAAPDLIATVSRSKIGQKLMFYPDGNETNHNHSLFNDAPEGVRLLNVLASERRKDHFIRFSDESGDIDINLPKKLTINGSKWRQRNGGKVFVPVNCVPAAAIPMILDDGSKSVEIFGCCANSLELRGGAYRVDGITLLPPGRLFVGLALLSFGFNPDTLVPINSEDMESGDDTFIDWIFHKQKNTAYALEEEWRIPSAVAFNLSCMDLGEELECQPDKIKALCKLFDGICGPMSVWDGYDVALPSVIKLKRDHKFGRIHFSGVRNKAISEDSSAASPHHLRDPITLSMEASGPKIQLACEGCKNPRRRVRSKEVRPSTDDSIQHDATTAGEETVKPSQQDADDSNQNNIVATEQFQCLKCKMTFSTQGAQDNHFELCNSHLQEQLYSYDLTPSITAEGSVVNEDQSKQAGIPCEGCNRSFVEKQEYMEHIAQCLSVGFCCVECNDLLPSWSSFLLHRKKCCIPNTAWDNKEY